MNMAKNKNSKFNVKPDTIVIKQMQNLFNWNRRFMI